MWRDLCKKYYDRKTGDEGKKIKDFQAELLELPTIETVFDVLDLAMVATGTYIYGLKGKEIKIVPESVEGTKEGYTKGPIVDTGKAAAEVEMDDAGN